MKGQIVRFCGSRINGPMQRAILKTLCHVDRNRSLRHLYADALRIALSVEIMSLEWGAVPIVPVIRLNPCPLRVRRIEMSSFVRNRDAGKLRLALFVHDGNVDFRS